MRHYRVSAAQESGDLWFRAEVHAWDPAQMRFSWEPIHSWSVAAPGDAADLAAVVDHSVSSRGWDLSKRPRRLVLPVELEVIPRDRVLIFESLATEIRHLDAQLEAHRLALKNLVADVPPIHSPGYVGTSLLSKIVGLSRQQLYGYATQVRDSLAKAYAGASQSGQKQILEQISEAEAASLQQ